MTKPTKWHVCAAKTDQPGHPPSLIRTFVVCMKKVWVLSYPLSAQRRRFSLGAQSFCWLCREAAHIRLVGSSILANWKSPFVIKGCLWFFSSFILILIISLPYSVQPVQICGV